MSTVSCPLLYSSSSFTFAFVPAQRFNEMVSFKLATLAVAAFSAVNVIAQAADKVCKLPDADSTNA